MCNVQTEAIPLVSGDLENKININQPNVPITETIKEVEDKVEPEKKKPVCVTSYIYKMYTFFYLYIYI